MNMLVSGDLEEDGEPPVEAHAEGRHRLQHGDIARHAREFIYADREIHSARRKRVAGFKSEQAGIAIESRHWNVLGNLLGPVLRSGPLRRRSRLCRFRGGFGLGRGKRWGWSA